MGLVSIKDNKYVVIFSARYIFIYFFYLYHECRNNRPSELFDHYVCVLVYKAYQKALSPENRALLFPDLLSIFPLIFNMLFHFFLLHQFQ
jgi:hypothetical protein